MRLALALLAIAATAVLLRRRRCNHEWHFYDGNDREGTEYICARCEAIRYVAAEGDDSEIVGMPTTVRLPVGMYVELAPTSRN